MVMRCSSCPGNGSDAADALACAICHAHCGLGAMPRGAGACARAGSHDAARGDAVIGASRACSPRRASAGDRLLSRRGLRDRRAHEHVLPLPRVGDEVTLLTHLVVRRMRTALRLLTAGERTAFRQLLKISGVGPKVALSVLSGSRSTTLRRRCPGDAARLTKVPESARRPRAPGAGTARQADEDAGRRARRGAAVGGTW